jgi:hypothetical protein
MKRIGFTGLVLVAAFALSGIAAESASAQLCFKVDLKEKGIFEDSGCTKEKSKGEYITATLEKEVKPGVWCAHVDHVGTGEFETNACTGSEVAKGEYTLVLSSEESNPGALRFSFCKKVGNVAGASFTSEACRSSEQSTSTGTYALAYADYPGALLLCLLISGGNYTNLFCNELSVHGSGDSEITLNTSFGGAPLILGIPITIATLKTHAAGLSSEISCRNGKFSFIPLESGTFEQGKLEYTNCTVPKPSGCSVKEPIIGEFNGKLAADKFLFIGNKETLTVKEIFAEIEYTNCSALAGKTFPVRGQQQCEGAAGILTLKLLQTLICRKGESSLKLGAEEATYENEASFHTTTKEYWAILRVTP